MNWKSIPPISSLHDQLFLFANGAFHLKGKGSAGTPLLTFQWNVDGDRVDGKVNAVGAKGGFSPARYFPAIGYVVLYKDSNFELWNPRTGRGGQVTIPDLTQIPNLYEFSPDGHWLLLAQIQTTSNADPSVVELKTHKFVDELRGHERHRLEHGVLPRRTQSGDRLRRRQGAYLLGGRLETYADT